MSQSCLPCCRGVKYTIVYIAWSTETLKYADMQIFVLLFNIPVAESVVQWLSCLPGHVSTLGVRKESLPFTNQYFKDETVGRMYVLIYNYSELQV